MEEAKISQITPGMCPPEGCPPPTRIECIVVDKVYDSCFQINDFTRDTTISNFAGPFAEGDVIPCRQNGDITCTEISRVDAGGGFFTVTLLISVPILLANPNNPNQTVDRTFTFTKTATLCCPQGVEPDCSESTLLFCNCVVSNTLEQTLSVTCTLQVCVVIKCLLEVQLLVPSYGFCVPAPCITLPGVCPPTPPAQCF
jgi:hypothetical protein